MSDKKIVYIVGTVGLPACYGGFETLVDNLVMYGDNVEYNVFCSSKNYEIKLETYNGAKLHYLNIKANGIQSVFYDLISLFLLIFKKVDVVLILGVSGALFQLRVGA